MDFALRRDFVHGGIASFARRVAFARLMESLSRSSMCRPTISVIVPTRNAESFLPATLESLSRQPGEHWECIFVDGLSSDGTLALLEDFCRSAKIPCKVSSETDQGVADALNKGIALAEGDYLYFLCAGDCLRPGVLDPIGAELMDQPDVLYGKVFEVSFNKLVGGEPVTVQHFACHNLYHQALFYRRSMFDRFGRYSLQYKSFSDYDYNLRWFCAPGVKVAYSGVVVADYLGGGPSEFGDPVFEEAREALVERYLGGEALAAVQMRRRARAEIFTALQGKSPTGMPMRWGIFGAGSYGRNMLIDRSVEKFLANFAGFLDNNQARWGSQFCGHQILSPSVDVLRSLDCVVLAVGDDRARGAIRAQLIETEFPQEAIFCW